jgi:hypothetical protein
MAGTCRTYVRQACLYVICVSTVYICPVLRLYELKGEKSKITSKQGCLKSYEDLKLSLLMVLIYAYDVYYLFDKY